jgi:hypothetical protein
MENQKTGAAVYRSVSNQGEMMDELFATVDRALWRWHLL